MNVKISPATSARLVGLAADEPVVLRLRTTTPLTPEQIDRLTSWGGTLHYDSGIVAVVTAPAGRATDIAAWEVVLDII